MLYKRINHVDTYPPYTARLLIFGLPSLLDFNRDRDFNKQN